MRHANALAASNAVPGPLANFSGHWKNELTSTMDLTVSGASVTGTYTSAVSGGGGSVTGPLVGYVDGSLISFVVNWPNAAITAWVGHLVVENGKDVLETLWQMTNEMANPNDPSELWESIFAGADRFTR